jgi:hypothetical protein
MIKKNKFAGFFVDFFFGEAILRGVQEKLQFQNIGNIGSPVESCHWHFSCTPGGPCFFSEGRWTGKENTRYE